MIGCVTVDCRLFRPIRVWRHIEFSDNNYISMNINRTVYVSVYFYNVFLYAFVRARTDACDYFPSCVIISYVLLIAKLVFQWNSRTIVYLSQRWPCAIYAGIHITIRSTAWCYTTRVFACIIWPLQRRNTLTCLTSEYTPRASVVLVRTTWHTRDTSKSKCSDIPWD